MRYLNLSFFALTFLLASLLPASAQPIVELTRFQLREGVSEAEFLMATGQMQAAFLDRQPGFLRRTLVKSESGWTDVIWWEEEAAHAAAMQAAEQDAAVAPFMQMIDFNRVEMEILPVKFSSQP